MSKKPPVSRLLPLLLSPALLIGTGAGAQAAGIPFSVIGPHEYTLPLDFEPIAEFVQSAEVNNNSDSFDEAGDSVDGPGGHTIGGSTKFAYLFQIRGLKRVGFEAEIIEPEVRVTGGPGAATGLGDPTAGVVAWIKPSAESTVGLQDYFVLPLGSEALSSHYTGNIFSVLGDFNPGNWDLDGDLGVILPLDHATPRDQPSERVGNVYFGNVRGSYRFGKHLEPFLGVDWQNTAGSADVSSGQPLAVTSGNETAGVAGLMWHFANGSLTASFHYGLDGRDVVRTNSFLLRWIVTF